MSSNRPSRRKAKAQAICTANKGISNGRMTAFVAKQKPEFFKGDLMLTAPSFPGPSFGEFRRTRSCGAVEAWCAPNLPADQRRYRMLLPQARGARGRMLAG